MSRRKGKGVDGESKKSDVECQRAVKKIMSPHKFFYGLFSVTQSLFLLGFSRRTDNITARNKKGTYGPVKALYLDTFHAVWVVYTTCLSKNLIASQVVIFQHVFWGLL